VHLCSGESFKDAAMLSKELGADYVGINCTSPELVTGLLESAKDYGPFVVYPNAGRTWNEKLKRLEGASVKLSDQHKVVVSHILNHPDCLKEDGSVNVHGIVRSTNLKHNVVNSILTDIRNQYNLSLL
jgi:hypothetical protein